MEDSLSNVASSCADQLNSYQRCILANQSNHGEACAEQKTALAICAADSVPLVRAVKTRCGPAIKGYDACLAKHEKSDDQTSLVYRHW
ncbi:COILED-COIL-HELIX-COILED-COIL-HELIX DOMAIN-CONTAINING PROTEIN 5 [Ceraceosorus bombacis]|uniref:COILED-COIL-HELIX-COILED-COIL-HELIX DOMAIN-CONTAINING PROTEIN 5 n=1 Tax=Ceraceosorus bombacis TaxID=401625 RepID=A0A0P1BFD3_9BASI|nr:COILED-COIL-HELIX-COILED-COIL-HELIX DOMAIN-CONTAINING PROTEIN 5 [Ceraceosorus bombacis]